MLLLLILHYSFKISSFRLVFQRENRGLERSDDLFNWTFQVKHSENKSHFSPCLFSPSHGFICPNYLKSTPSIIYIFTLVWKFQLSHPEDSLIWCHINLFILCVFPFSYNDYHTLKCFNFKKWRNSRKCCISEKKLKLK